MIRALTKKRNKKKTKDKDKNLGEKILWYACRWPQWEPPSSLRPALRPHDDDDDDYDDDDNDDGDDDDGDDEYKHKDGNHDKKWMMIKAKS